VKRTAASDRRQFPRFPEVLEVRVREIQPLRSAIGMGKAVTGRVHNISHGGICFISAQPIRQSSPVRCCIRTSEAPVTIPTLMQVRWIQKHKLQANTYLIGLQFLL
jgi:PilZ domain